MIFIFGFGKPTIKKYGIAQESICSHCNNNTKWHLVKITRWMTLFFIPIIPYSFKRGAICPICHTFKEMNKEEFEEAVKEGLDGELVIDELNGKTQTQINYLKEMEALRKEREESESANL